MIQFQTEVEVPESREVTLKLPADTPIGRGRVTVTTAPLEATTHYYRPADPAVAVEFDGFLRLLLALRPTHGGHFVAVRGGRVIASGVYLDPVL